MSDQRNLIIAIVLSVGIILAFQFFYEMPKMREAQLRQAAENAQTGHDRRRAGACHHRAGAGRWHRRGCVRAAR